MGICENIPLVSATCLPSSTNVFLIGDFNSRVRPDSTTQAQKKWQIYLIKTPTTLDSITGMTDIQMKRLSIGVKATHLLNLLSKKT